MYTVFYIFVHSGQRVFFVHSGQKKTSGLEVLKGNERIADYYHAEMA